MRLSTGRIQLHGAGKALKQRWEDTKEGWKDPVCKTFDDEFFMPIAVQVENTIRGIDRLAGVLGQMQVECE